MKQMLESKPLMISYVLFAALIILKVFAQISYQYFDSHPDLFVQIAMHLLIIEALGIILFQLASIILTTLTKFFFITALQMLIPCIIAGYATGVSYLLWDLHKKHVLRPLYTGTFLWYPQLMLGFLAEIFLSTLITASNTHRGAHLTIILCYGMATVILLGKARRDKASRTPIRR